MMPQGSKIGKRQMHDDTDHHSNYRNLTWDDFMDNEICTCMTRGPLDTEIVANWLYAQQE